MIPVVYEANGNTVKAIVIRNGMRMFYRGGCACDKLGAGLFRFARATGVSWISDLEWLL